jgi:hypothetical protein
LPEKWTTACCELSKIYEQSGDLVLAEKCARQAVEQDEFYDWCGVYAHGVEMELIGRVRSLNARILDQEQKKKNSPTRH